ncbi:MAG: type 1 glutamine amidotransferase [Deltaproteobacteria bacterium]|nr:type 1 glutamine amidotransferase [Deltaproteobacteria bacterium]
MNALVIMHVESEGPGTLGEFLKSYDFTIKTARVYKGDDLPKNTNSYDLVISMGGPMNVDEEDRYPFLADEKRFLKNVIESNTPVIGICPDAQMITRALGSSVYKADTKEIGLGDIFLVDEGKREPIFRGLPENFTIIHWHEDTFDLPNGAKLLASSKDCKNQAFRYRNAYGFQFHIEVNYKMVAEWFDDSSNKDEILKRFKEIEDSYLSRAYMIYGNFMKSMYK